MSLLPRKNIAALEKCPHGGIDCIEIENLGITPDSVIDFSVSTGPNGMPAGIRPLVKGTKLTAYPDPQCIRLRRAIAGKIGLSLENVMIGNGSTEIIRLAVMAYLHEREKALILEPTYGEYHIACQIAGAQVISETSTAGEMFKPDIGTIIKLIEQVKPKVIFICNPNNPTGHYLGRSQFNQILSAAIDSLVILDEAHISFVRKPWNSCSFLCKGNLLIIRSMTKDYSLAGLRLGYAVASPEIIDTLLRICPPWNVNVVAQHAGVIALQQDKYLRDNQNIAIAGKKYLLDEIAKLGFRCLPSETNFFLIEVGNAAVIKSQLLRKGILVRDCTSFGLPEYIRVAPKTPKKNRKFIAAMKEIRNTD